jgi:hypothetical protein
MCYRYKNKTGPAGEPGLAITEKMEEGTNEMSAKIV